MRKFAVPLLLSFAVLATGSIAVAGAKPTDFVCTAKETGRSFVLEIEENHTIKVLGPGNQLVRFSIPARLTDPNDGPQPLHGSRTIKVPPEDNLAIWTLSFWTGTLNYKFEVISPPMQMTIVDSSKYLEVGACAATDR